MPNIRLALRTLFKSPFITLVAILSLGLGIGANSAIFSMFDQMLLRPLPVPAPHELVNLQAPGPKHGSQSCNQAGDCEHVFSYAMFRDLQKEHAVFTDIAAHVLFGANLAWLHDCDPCLGPGACRFTSSCGAGTGSGRSSIWLNSEKIAALAPIPSARDRIATEVTNGALNSRRKASLRLFIVQQ